MIVRPLAHGDFDAWLPRWRGYLAFYETDFREEIARLTWSRFHDPLKPVFALGAWDGDRLLGIAHYHIQRSTWAPIGYVCLEDLFTVPKARRRGVGRRLIDAVRLRAEEVGASRLHWTTQTGNGTARRLHDTIADVADFVQYRTPI